MQQTNELTRSDIFHLKSVVAVNRIPELL